MGAVVDRILAEGYEISAMKIWDLAKPLVEEFCEVYRGVVQEYSPFVLIFFEVA